MPRNDQTLNIPCRPSLGSQKFRAMSAGLRGKDPGGNDLPRSSTQTRCPPSARRYAVTDPPKPEPTTTASKCSFALVPTRRLPYLAKGLGPQTTTVPREALTFKFA